LKKKENRWYKKYSDEVEIELNSVEEMMDFVKKWGKIIVDNDFSNVPRIRIFDDYL